MGHYKIIFYAHLLLLMMVLSCSSDSNSAGNEGKMMGKFDSLIIAQEKGPSIEAYYEQKVIHVTFPSLDSLLVSADIYEYYDSTIKFLYCHQAGYSKGEYINTAIFLSQMGYSGMAVDLRSGGTVNNIENTTANLAIKKGVKNDYIDAKQDIEAAINYIFNCNGGVPITLVGSSYSASLCLIVAKNNPKVKAVIAFSPGEYLEDISVGELLEGMDKPVFVTSSKMEIQQTAKIVAGIDADKVDQYKPLVEGIHGSSVLWQSTMGFKDYWKAMLDFIIKINTPVSLEEVNEIETTIEKDSISHT